MFVVFENTKSRTDFAKILQIVSDRLCENELQTMTTKEPTCRRVVNAAEKIKKVQCPSSAQKTAQIYFADRLVHCIETIYPALVAQKIILCDTYKYDYACAPKNDKQTTKRILQMNGELPRPDLVFVFLRGNEKKDRNFLGLPEYLPRESFVFVPRDLEMNEAVDFVFCAISKKIDRKLNNLPAKNEQFFAPAL